jgi:hypothetical protein
MFVDYWDCLPQLAILGRNLPPVELLKELDLIVGVDKLRPGFPVVSQVVDQMLESAAIPVDEDFLVDFLQLMVSTKHL